MTIPGSPPVDAWSALGPDDKDERLLAAAAGVFSRRGLDAPMSEVADAAGAGVASIYRRYPSKRELAAALVIRRMEQIRGTAAAAERAPGDRWSAFCAALHELVAEQSVEPFIAEARALVQDHPDVDAATDRAHGALERMLEAARAEGRLRADATLADLQLLFAATRAARRQEPASWPRMLELLIDALDGRRGA